PQAPVLNYSGCPAFAAWQAFAVRVLVEGGRNADSHLTRLYGYRDRMPVFAMAYLHDALVAQGEGSGARGGARPAGALADPYLLWFWNSNVRSTAIVLNSLVKAGVDDALLRGLVRWMM